MRSLVAIALATLVGCHTPTGAELPAESSVASTPTSPEDVLARWNGGEVDRADVEARIGDDLRELEIRYLLARHELMARTVDQIADEAILAAAAAARGLPSVDALLAVEVDATLEEPTDEQVRALYPLMGPQLGGVPYEIAGPIVREELVRRARERRYRIFLAELRGESALEHHLPWPDLPRVAITIDDHDPVEGPEDAAVTVIEFADHTCTWCVAAGDTLVKLRETWPDDVRIVWKDFPLAGNPRALPAALAAHCAGEQGRFWDMHERLLDHQEALGDGELIEHASGLGLDHDQFEDCLMSSRPLQGVYADLEVAREAGVRAAPTFFVNGIVVPGVQPWPAFAAIVERELERTASR